jgi:glycine dehydrogenase subunit 1
MALASAVYLSLLGKEGLREVAELCYHRAHYAAQQIAAAPGFNVLTTAPFFHEFIVECPLPAAEVNNRLLEYGIIGGYDLHQAYCDRPEMLKRLLVAVTEMNSRADIDNLVEALTEVTHA